MKLAYVCLALLASATLVSAADATDTAFGWKRSANGEFSLSQIYFDNWAQGGVDAFNWGIHLDGDFTLERPHDSWESKGKAEYGQSQLDGLSSRASADELDLETIYTRKIGVWVNPFAASALQSQFAPGYLYNDTNMTRQRIAGIFDPTYITQTLGMGRNWQNALKLRLGGTLKETFSAARYGYADDPSTPQIETYKIEPGVSLNVAAKQGLMENILLKTALDVFVNFKGVDAIYGRWQNQVTAKVNKYISADFDYEMLYDKTLSLSRQIKESLAISVSFLTL